MWGCTRGSIRDELGRGWRQLPETKLAPASPNLPARVYTAGGMQEDAMSQDQLPLVPCRDHCLCSNADLEKRDTAKTQEMAGGPMGQRTVGGKAG